MQNIKIHAGLCFNRAVISGIISRSEKEIFNALWRQTEILTCRQHRLSFSTPLICLKLNNVGRGTN